MNRARVTFRQDDLARALKAAAKAHVLVTRTEIAPDGRIILFHGQESTAPASPFDEWKARRDAR